MTPTEHLDANRDRHVAELVEFVSIPSVSADPARAADVVRAAIARVPCDEAEYLAETGAPAAVGEPGYTTRERLRARPALDVNALTNGHRGAGTKTVLPAEARAKITYRLVADQSPERVFDALAAHVAAPAPPGVRGGRAHAGPTRSSCPPATTQARSPPRCCARCTGRSRTAPGWAVRSR